MRTILIAIAAAMIALPATADEKPVDLKKAPGLDKVEGNCGACHSLDYIQMNSVFLDREGWQKSVDKMVKVMGAPIRPEDVPAIVDYLTAAYGK